MLVGGLVMMGFAALDPENTDVLIGVGAGGLSLVVTGVVFLGVSRYLESFSGADALDDAVSGTARVLSVADTGVTINGVNAVLKVRATINVPAADVIARGIATQGVLHAADPTGLTAGQVLTTLPAHEADDPLMKVVFTYQPTGMGEQRTEVLVRVPDGKGPWLVAGETLPVVYLPDDPTTATIDWSRL